MRVYTKGLINVTEDLVLIEVTFVTVLRLRLDCYKHFQQVSGLISESISQSCRVETPSFMRNLIKRHSNSIRFDLIRSHSTQLNSTQLHSTQGVITRRKHLPFCGRKKIRCWLKWPSLQYLDSDLIVTNIITRSVVWSLNQYHKIVLWKHPVLWGILLKGIRIRFGSIRFDPTQLERVITRRKHLP